jgi:hypothetical protein
MRRLLLSSLIALATLAAVPAANGAGQRVTVIGDSVLTSVAWYSENLAILEQGVELDVHAAVCRRLARTSCPFEGVAPPTLLDLLPSLPDLAGTVVVEMGYNDDPARFRADVEETIARLSARGATRIVWSTLRVSRSEFAAMNGVLLESMAAHPELSLVDWDAFAEGHPDWFQTDNLHLTRAGGTGLATLLHLALAEPLVLPRQATLPAAQRGRRYRARLGEVGGSWQVVAGRIPRGLHLGAGGVVSGRPLQAGFFRARLLYRSAGFQLAYQELVIRVAAPARASAART